MFKLWLKLVLLLALSSVFGKTELVVFNGDWALVGLLGLKVDFSIFCAFCD